MPKQVRTAAIALGSNLTSGFGDRAANLREATDRVGRLGEIVAVSSFFDTEAEIYTDQPRFLNAALLLRTVLTLEALMHALLAIETAMGRERAGFPAKGPRIIDLDLILVDDLIVQTELLRLPHPGLAERRFVLEPLAEIAPEWVHPELGSTVLAMLERLPC